MTELKRKPILIPIDHGYGNVKTPNFIFPTGITEYKEEPAIATDTLRWASRWYAIGDSHKEFIADKRCTSCPLPYSASEETGGQVEIDDEDYDIADGFMSALGC